jgi:hypothetical protein
MPANPKSTRVLIPRVRRALDGPAALASGSPGVTLTDPQVEALVADAIASVIFFTGGLWGHQLVVTERDDNYGAPIAWETSDELTEAEATVIVAEAAIGYFFQMVKDLKVQETISNEGQSWQYALSANAIVEWLKHLRQMRDDALTRVDEASPIAPAYASFLYTRDAYAASHLEPFTVEAGGSFRGGQELAT